MRVREVADLQNEFSERVSGVLRVELTKMTLVSPAMLPALLQDRSDAALVAARVQTGLKVVEDRCWS